MKKQSINNGELLREFPPFQINDVSADYDMNIVNTTYYHDIEDADLAESINHYIDNGWVLLYDACGLLKAQEEEK